MNLVVRPLARRVGLCTVNYAVLSGFIAALARFRLLTPVLPCLHSTIIPAATDSCKKKISYRFPRDSLHR